MATQSQIRTYERREAIVFRKTAERFGGLSNMAPGYPICINKVKILTSEALYQACRFPHRPEVQKLILSQTSPMTAKMRSKPYRPESRTDWERVKLKAMRWCIRVKLVQNWENFSELLLKTAEKPIVEESSKDDYWAAKPVGSDTLTGINALGRLLMELREEIRNGVLRPNFGIEPPNIPEFILYDKPIGLVEPVW